MNRRTVTWLFVKDLSAQLKVAKSLRQDPCEGDYISTCYYGDLIRVSGKAADAVVFNSESVSYRDLQGARPDRVLMIDVSLDDLDPLVRSEIVSRQKVSAR